MHPGYAAIRLIVGIVISFLCFSCSLPMYRPVSANTPVFDSVGQFEVRVDLKNAMANLSISDHLFLSGQVQSFDYSAESRFVRDGDDHFKGTNEIFLPQLGLGYYGKTKNFRYHFMAGGGLGFQNYKVSGYDGSYFSSNYWYELKTNVINSYLAAGMAFGDQGIRQIFQLRFSPVFYLKKEFSSHQYDESPAILRNMDFRYRGSIQVLYFEPSYTFRKEWKIFFVQGQTLLNVALTNQRVEPWNFWMNFSIGAKLDQLFK